MPRDWFTPVLFSQGPRFGAEQWISPLSDAVGYWDALYYDGSGTLVDLTGNGRALALAAGSNAPLFLPRGTLGYLYLPGISQNSGTIPFGGFGGALELDSVVELAFDDVTAVGDLFGQYNSGSNRRCFTTTIGTAISKRFTLFVSSNGTGANNATSGADWPYANGVRAALRSTWRSSDGRVQFFTATDLNRVTGAATWAKLGADPTPILTGLSLFSNAIDPLYVGGKVDQGTNVAGKYFYASAASTIGGAANRAANLSDVYGLYNTARTSFTALTGQTGAVNRSASGRKSVGLSRPTFLCGTDDYFEAADNAAFNFAHGESFTQAIAGRLYGTPGLSVGLMCKSTAFAAAGWTIRFGGSTAPILRVGDGVATVDATAPAVTAGIPFVAIGRRNTAVPQIDALVNAIAGVASADTTAGSLSNAATLQIGRSPTNAFVDFEFFAAAVWRRSLSAADVTNLTPYLLAGT